MFTTRRLGLVPLTRSLLVNRLDRSGFEMVCALECGPTPVYFPASWPGDALAMFPDMRDRLPIGQEAVMGSFVAVHLETRTAIGQLGTVGEPDADGTQEIGYGFNDDARGQGFATEAVVALTAHLMSWGSVTTVTANTAVTNPASARVLEKAGFQQSGTGRNSEDGYLLSWSFSAVGSA